MTGHGCETEVWAAGWRLAHALCAASGGRLHAERSEALDGFYQGIGLRATATGHEVGFLNVPASLHVFRRVDGDPVGAGRKRCLELNWKKPCAGQPRPEPDAGASGPGARD